jgi:predicted DNA-binding mobile mystery protein A
MSSPNKLTDAADHPSSLGRTVRPTLGWLRTVRDELGLTLVEIADRMKVTPPAIRSFEQAEAEDRITMASLRRAAAAMDCDLVYALVSKAGPAKSSARRKTSVKPAKPVPPPTTGHPDNLDSIVTDLTRRTEYGES